MRKILLALAVLFSLAVQPTLASAGPAHKDFVQAWSERDARYVKEHGDLDKVAREATAQFLQTPQSEPRLLEMIAAIKAASYLDGRGALLRDLRIRIEKKPSPAKVELWMQEYSELVQSDSRSVQAQFDKLRRMREAGQGGSDSYFEAFVASIIMSSTLQGKAEELDLLDQNLASYLRARGAEDVARRESRGRLLRALAAGLGGAATAAPPPIRQGFTTRCDTYGAQTTCRTQ
jgi:hypothetical protein